MGARSPRPPGPARRRSRATAANGAGTGNGADREGGRPYAGVSFADRREDQHNRLVRAAIDAFGENGVSATSVEDIVRRARTSRAAFYSFFTNRDACLLEAYRRVAADVQARVAEAIATMAPGDDRVEVAVRAYIDTLLDDPPAARVLLTEAVGVSPEIERVRADVREELARGLLASWRRVDPKRAAAPDAPATCIALVGALGESIAHLIWTDRFDEAPDLVPALTGLLSRAMRTS